MLAWRQATERSIGGKHFCFFMREKAHKLVGRRQKGEVKETEGGKILLHETAGT